MRGWSGKVPPVAGQLGLCAQLLRPGRLYKDLYYNDFARHLSLKSTLYAGDFTIAASYDSDTEFYNTSETTEKREFQGSIVYDADFIRLSIADHWYMRMTAITAMLLVQAASSISSMCG